MNIVRLSVIFLILFMISFPLSVTASQTFAILSFFTFLYSSFLDKSLINIIRNRAFITSLLLYVSLIPSFLLNIFTYKSTLLSALSKSELSDFWMSFIVLPAFYYIRNPKYKTMILRALYISAGLVLVSGIISIFTPFRLAQFITSGFVVQEGSRLQHFAGDYWGRYTFLPIGLMNTHLTFGGLIGLLYPGLLIHFAITFRERKVAKNILIGFLFLLFTILLFYNQSRSIWVGICFVFVIYGLKILQNFDLSLLKFRLKYLLITLGVLFLISIASIGIYKKNWLIQRAFQEGLADNTTENQRYFIYKNTFNILKNHWLIGVGPSRFDEEHRNASDKMIEQNEQLWYELFITPRQHAHHDLLHFYAIGGLLGLFAYLQFWFYLFRLFWKNKLEPLPVSFIGIFVLFIGGFFQCYLLDDEVALPFFACVGFFAGCLQQEGQRTDALAGIRSRRKNNPNDSYHVESISIGSSFLLLKRQFALDGKNYPLEKYNFYTLITLLLPILFSISFIAFKIRLDPMQVYKRKVTVGNVENRKYIFNSLKGNFGVFPTKNMTDSDFIKIEGCLSHSFTSPIQIRKEPYLIKFSLPALTKNAPREIKIRIKERDAFDQDRLYKVHQSRDIGEEFIFELANNNSTIIKFDIEKLNQNIKDSNRFPDNIYFRDFEFQFRGFDSSMEYFDLPAIDFGKLCDAK